MPNPLTPAAIVDDYLRLLMIPDPAAARRYVAADLQIPFSGDRALREPAECAAFNATRYRWVKKRIDATETVAACEPGRTVVYSAGTRYGEGPDGTPFEGDLDVERDVERCVDRHVDRCETRHRLIAQLKVCNDNSEWSLDRAARGPSQ